MLALFENIRLFVLQVENYSIRTKWVFVSPLVTTMSEMTIADHRRVSIMSSLDAGWFRLITNILIQSRDLAMIARWHQCGTMTSQMLARASFPPSVWPSSRSNFDLGPSPSDSTEKNSIISELMILECSFPLNGQKVSCLKLKAFLNFKKCPWGWHFSCKMKSREAHASLLYQILQLNFPKDAKVKFSLFKKSGKNVSASTPSSVCEKRMTNLG